MLRAEEKRRGLRGKEVLERGRFSVEYVSFQFVQIECGHVESRRRLAQFVEIDHLMKQRAVIQYARRVQFETGRHRVEGEVHPVVKQPLHNGRFTGLDVNPGQYLPELLNRFGERAVPGGKPEVERQQLMEQIAGVEVGQILQRLSWALAVRRDR
jgi:hypothetical protein